MIEGSNWLLKVIFGGCIFLRFSTKIDTFWSLSQRNYKFVPLCVFYHILSAKVVFWYIFRSIFSKEIVNVRVGNKTFEKLGKHQKFWVGGGGGAKIHTWGCGAKRNLGRWGLQQNHGSRWGDRYRGLLI